MISIWEKLSLIKKDIVLIGSGITGLTAALHIKDLYSERNVTVIEKGILPSGASTKNAGFACFGSLSEIIDDLFTMTEEEIIKLVTLRLEGLSILKKKFPDNQLDYQQNGGYELINHQDTYYLEKIDLINELLRPIFKTECFLIRDEKIKEFGFNEKKISNLVYTPFEGQIDTGKMMSGLLEQCRSAGIEFLTNTEIVDLTDYENEVALQTGTGITFTAKKVLIATNGFTKELLPELNIKPGRGLVLSTKPIDNLKFKGTFHMDKGYFYFRNFNNRIILGGGRNLDFEKETTTHHEINEKILSQLEQILENVILPGQSYEIDMKWTGIMGFGTNKQTTVKSHSKNISLAVGLGGMGVAIGSIIGKQLAEIGMKH